MALSVLVHNNIGELRRQRFPWGTACAAEGAAWTVRGTDSVGRLKGLIAERIGVPPAAQDLSLVHDPRVAEGGGSGGGANIGLCPRQERLADSQTLGGLGLGGGSSLWLRRS